MAKKFRKTLALVLAVIMTVSLMGGLTVFAGDDETVRHEPVETVSGASGQSGGEDPAVPEDEGKDPAVPEDEGKDPAVPEDEGKDPAVPEDEGKNPAAPEDKGEGTLVPADEGENPDGDKDKGKALVARNCIPVIPVPPMAEGTDANVSIPVSKVWANDTEANRPADGIIYKLYETVNGIENPTPVRTQTVTGPDWEYTFEDLPSVDEDGNVITYTIVEDAVSGYTTTYTQPNFTITNLPTDLGHTPCNKTEIDLDANIAEGVNLVIIKKGSDYVVWSTEKLNGYMQNAVLSAYSSVLSGASSINYFSGYGEGSLLGEVFSISKDGVSGHSILNLENKSDWSWLKGAAIKMTTSFPATVTNTYSPLATKDVTVTKVWDVPAGHIHPTSVPISLYNDAVSTEKPYATATLSADTWTHEFKGIPDATYRVEEDDLDGGYLKTRTAWYEVTINGFVITNKYKTPTEILTSDLASFNIKKVDGNGDLITDKSAEFTLYTDEACQTPYGSPVTTTNGVATVSNLTAGTYYLKETKAPEGYDQVDTIWTITVTASNSTTGTYDSETNTLTKKTINTVSSVTVGNEPTDEWNGNDKVLTVSNYRSSKDIIVTKTWANVPEGITHPTSVPIKLYQPDSTDPVHNGSISGTGDSWTLNLSVPNATNRVAESDESGNDIAEGGYLKTRTAWYTVSYSTSGFAITNTYVTPGTNPDVEVPAAFTIAKVDASGNAITGEGKSAEFTLKNSDDTVYGTYNTSATDGKAQITGLKTGVYKLTETKAPAGYQDADTVWTITVTSSENTVYDAATNKTTKTTAYTVDGITVSEGSLTWNDDDKVLTVKNSLIPLPDTINIDGEKFWVFPNDDGLPQGVVLPESVTIKLYENVEGVKTEVRSARVTPDDDGNWKYRFENLPYGHSYFVEEVVLDNGYLKTDTAWYEVTIDGYDVTNTYVEPEHEDADPTPAEFIIRKENTKGNLISSSNATFTLYDEEYQPTLALLAAGTTESNWITKNGTVKVTGLKEGHFYSLKETKAPSDYKRVDTTWYIQVESDESSETSSYDKDTNTWTHTYKLVVRDITLADGMETKEWNGETNTLTVKNTYIGGDDGGYDPPTTPTIEIPETEPPLGPPEVTEPPTGTDPVEDIEEEDVPRDASPKTGDNTSTFALWAALGLSFAGIAATALTGKRGKKRSPASGK